MMACNIDIDKLGFLTLIIIHICLKFLVDLLQFNFENSSFSEHAKKEELILSSWRELLDNPKHWWDNRDRKRNGSVMNL